jgi:hypothetical protein
MKLTATILAAVCFLLAASFAAGQMPAPAPELKKVDYFAGTWSFEGDMKPGPMGPGGKVTGTNQSSWMEGGFFLVGHSEFHGPMGDAKGLAVFGYDSASKTYTYNEFNSMGENNVSTGVLEGDTWTWNSTEKMGSTVLKSRFTIKQLSPTAYTFKFEMAPEGAEMATVMEGKATKK